MPIIGLGTRSAEYAGLPLQWMPHIQVADVAASLSRVRSEGGKIIKEITAADGGCAYAVVEDPVVVILALVPG